MQPQRKTLWRFLKKLKIARPYDAEIPLLGIYPKKKKSLGILGSSVVKNLPPSAGDKDPWSGRIPHAMKQLSPCAITIESVFYSLGTTTIEPMRCDS